MKNEKRLDTSNDKFNFTLARMHISNVFSVVLCYIVLYLFSRGLEKIKRNKKKNKNK